jgi:hypothetical protein
LLEYLLDPARTFVPLYAAPIREVPNVDDQEPPQLPRLPEAILVSARAADAVREGPRGSAWFAHRDGAGLLTGIEVRGSDYRIFSAGGDNTLFRLPAAPAI